MIERLKQHKLILIIFIIGIILIVTGTTYSFYKIKLEGQKQHIVSSDVISFTYKESEDKISITNMNPISDTQGKKNNYFEFKVSSKLKENMNIKYIVSLSKIDIENSFEDNDIKMYLTDGNDNELISPTIISLLEENKKIKDSKIIYANTFAYNQQEQTHTYRIRIWLKENVDMSKYTKVVETETGTNVSLEQKTYKFKINVNTVVENEETIITGADTLIKLTDNKDNSGLYTITHPKDTTLQIGNDNDITEYRYRGASPKNYVTFNNEVWRIIGVFSTDDGTGKIENRIKIIKDQSIGNKYWDTSGSNNWARPATLNTELNTTYLNSLDSTAQNMISNTKYYLGGKAVTYNNGYVDTPLQFYSYERKINGSAYYDGTNPNSWVGKLGLMYLSDYGYASSNCENKKIWDNNSSSNDIRACNGTNWLFKGNTEWILPQVVSDRGNVFYVLSVGYIGGSFHFGTQYGVRPVLYLKPDVKIIAGAGTSTDPYVIGINQKDGANAPVLASNMIPVYYDNSKNVWKYADKDNKDSLTRWYHYDYKIWANAVTINYSDSSIKNRYFNSDGTLKIKPGDDVLMNDITTMWVWIPRFNAVTPSNYNGGTKDNPRAIDVTFVKQNETALDAFTFGNKELSGFWYGKFETSHTTLESSTTDNNLGCTNETCSNANNILIKPNLVSLRNNNVRNFFYASRSMEQPNNSFGFINTEVDTHMSKNSEWGAVAYLTQSIYGRCTSNTTCSEVGINNNSNYKTGYGAPAGSDKTVSNGAYNTTLGTNASTTGNIYGIYDMSGGGWDYVMGVYNKSIANSGFSSLPDTKYYNNYTGTSYTGHALTETKNWYNDIAYFFVSNTDPWFKRGGYYEDNKTSGIFNFDYYNGNLHSRFSTRFALTNE